MTTTQQRVVDLDPGEFGVLIVSRNGGARPVLAVSGEIDAATAPRLVASFEAVAAPRPHTITVDLTEVSFMDSSGVNAIVDLCTLVGTWHGTVVVTGVAPNVRRVFELTGIEARDALALR